MRTTPHFTTRKLVELLLTVLAIAYLSMGAGAQTLTNVYDFTLTPDTGQFPYQLVQAGNGTLYGITASGGSSGAGTLFAVQPDGSGYQVASNVPAGSISQNIGPHLFIGPGSALYAWTWGGGTNDQGAIWQISASGNWSSVFLFSPSTGVRPSWVITGSDGNLYGVTYYGGANNFGVLFMVAAEGTGYTVLHSFGATTRDGENPGYISQGADGTIYGVTERGGDANSDGTIFSYNPVSGVYKMRNALGGGAAGADPWTVLLASDGNLYGMTHVGGANNFGVIYRLTPAGAYTALMSLPTDFNPGALVDGGGQRLYGLFSYDGFGGGILFSLNVAEDPASYTPLDAFTQGGTFTDASPWRQSLLLGRDGALYGVMNGESTETYGAVFCYVPAVSGLSLSASPVTAGSTLTGKVILAEAAPTGGALVTLSSSSSAVTVPGSVKVAAGAMTASFTVATSASISSVVKAAITGTYIGSSRTATLKINPELVSSLSLDASNVTAGKSIAAMVKLTQPAPHSGITISLGGQVTGVTYPVSISIGSGETSGSFTIRTATSIASSTTVTVSATVNSSAKSTALMVQPNVPFKISLSPSTANGGGTSIATVTLASAAPAGGLTFALTSNNASVSFQASTVTIAAGAATGATTMNVEDVTANASAKVSATLGTTSQSATLTIIPVLVQSLTLSASSVTAGGVITGTVTLNNPALTGGQVVALTGSSASVSYPSSLTIAQGKSTGTFTITTSASITSAAMVTVRAACNGSLQSQMLTVNPETVSSVSLSLANVTAGKSVIATVNLSQPAPHSGVTVSLSGQVTGVTYPASISIGSGETSGTFTIRTATSITSTTVVTVTASINGVPVGATLTIQPVTSFKMAVEPSTVKGGSASTATITLASAAPAGGLTFSLTSNNGAVVSFQPSTITIAAGQTTGSAAINTTTVTAGTAVTITATLGTTNQTATLNITP